MDYDTRIFKCRCGNCLHINFLTRKVTVLGSGEDQAEDLDELLVNQEKEEASRGQRFDQALEDGAKEKDRLNSLFEDAKKKVSEENDDERPQSIFDLD